MKLNDCYHETVELNHPDASQSLHVVDLCYIHKERV